jgi:transposase
MRRNVVFEGERRCGLWWSRICLRSDGTATSCTIGCWAVAPSISAGHRGNERHAALYTAVRVKAGRNPQPSAAIIDSQSVKTTIVGGPRGYDGGKKVNGRKRHLLVDTQGLVIGALVHPADIADRDGAKLLLALLQDQLPRLQHIWADSAYAGTCAEWVRRTLGWTMEIVKHWWTGVRWVWVGPGQAPPTIPSGFHVLPRRWVVERKPRHDLRYTSVQVSRPYPVYINSNKTNCCAEVD